MGMGPRAQEKGEPQKPTAVNLGRGAQCISVCVCGGPVCINLWKFFDGFCFITEERVKGRR